MKTLLGWVGLLFSSYCQAQVAMITPGSLSVDDNGALTYTIPIKVPPGGGGVEPKLALVYNSQGGNGLLGIGGSISGLSAITRCPRTVSQDAVRGSVNFDQNDRYCLDGQRLVAVSGTDGKDGTEYRTERESFSKIVSYGVAGNGPASFKVWTKSGLLMEYGVTSDSRIEAVKAPSAAPTWPIGTVATWALNKVSDIKGNYYNVVYCENNTDTACKENSDSAFYPIRIDYTGNSQSSVSPMNSVKFQYDGLRPDVVPVYHAGAQIKNIKRMTNILSYADGVLVADYRLQYALDQPPRPSRLTSVQQCSGISGGCLEAVKLSFKNEVGGFSGDKTFLTDDLYSWGSDHWSYGDFNGDGKTDIIYHLNSPNYTKRIKFSNGDGSFTDGPTFTAADAYSWNSDHWSYGDFNGDGKTDIIYHLRSPDYTKRIKFSNGDGSFTDGPPFTATDAYSWNSDHWSYGDFNGDGKTDIIYHLRSPNYTKRIKFSNGDGSFTDGPPFTATDAYSWNSDHWSYGDFNGDGKTDIIYHLRSPNYTKRIKFSNGDGSFTDGPPFTATDAYSWSGDYWSYGDFNGDGKTDIIYHLVSPSYTKRIKFSNGDGTFTDGPTFFTADLYSFASDYWSYGDFNGDGKTDIIYHLNSAGYKKRIKFSKGDGTFVDGPILTITDPYSWSRDYWTYGDFNGDGKMDVIYHLNSPAYTKRVLFFDSPLDFAYQLFNPDGRYFYSFDYSFSSDKTVSSNIYPIQHVLGGVKVVSSVSMETDAGALTTTYRYGGLKAEVGTGRGMLGFAWSEATQQETGVVTRTEYRQDWPYVGMPSRVVVSKSGAGNGGVLKETSNTFSCLDPASTSGAACSVGPGKRYFPFVSQSVDKGWDLDGSVLPVVTTKSTYDCGTPPYACYGNAITVSVSNSDGSSKTTTNTYSNDAANWRLGRLLRSVVTSTTP